MNTIAHRTPRLSRAKALIAAMLATLAIAGAAQVAAPDPAAAMKSTCSHWMEEGHRAEGEGRQELADFYYTLYTICVFG
jgi:ABC-type glycerol-3-phosphate transport system substrate-binding protein